MKTRRALFLWLLNVLVLAGSLALVYLIRRDADTVISAYAKQYLAARAEADLENWRQTLETSAGYLAKVRAAFVSRESLIKFIEELEAVARESDVNLTLDEPVIGQTSLTLSLKVDGSFVNLYRWLARLENLPYPLTFERINLRAAAGWSGDISLALDSFRDDYVQN
ncbi:MAG: hypothetical protein HY481_02380 [Candidatus Vogelbacteria bacterium]|nr:hypothetical protein [Candidatus Vogelbacteria bacterium]